MDDEQIDRIVAATLAAALLAHEDGMPSRTGAIDEYRAMLRQVRDDREREQRRHR
jgi:hypothetical protein